MYIALCDDDPQVLQNMTRLLDEWQQENRITVSFKTFHSAVQMLDAAEKERFSLYFLDVLMPGMDGMAAARSIREFDDSADIVFLTNSPEFALESYGVHALDYLIKPPRRETLFPVLARVVSREQNTMDALSVKCGSALVRIPYYKLTYVEVNGKHLYFNLTDGTVRETIGTLKEVEPLLLSRPEFMQPHRSYIVNMLQVEQLSPAGILTYSGKLVPVSRLLYPQLQKDYFNLLFARKES